jgi:Dienelactone hydrolase family/Enoyl-(Acyl carrier protein) reductase
VDLKARKIRVNAISPGTIPTPGYDKLGLTPEQMTGFLAQQSAAIPLGRVGSAEEIANAELFLASDDSSYVNGIELFVDGGVSQIRNAVVTGRRAMALEETTMQETLTYNADGLTMKSQLFYERRSGTRAGVLVFPEAYGLNQHALERAERLASLGYVALACDLHGEARVVEDLGESIEMLDSLYADPSKTRARAMGGLHALAVRPEVDAARIGTIGFCFGGTMSLELARSGADIKAVVGFHSGLGTVAPKTDAKAIKG